MRFKKKSLGGAEGDLRIWERSLALLVSSLSLDATSPHEGLACRFCGVFLVCFRCLWTGTACSGRPSHVYTSVDLFCIWLDFVMKITML